MAILFHALNYVPEVGEFNDGEVITQPDMTLSMREMIRKFTATGSIQASYRQPVFNESWTFDDIANMDIGEYQEFRERLDYAYEHRQEIETNESGPRSSETEAESIGDIDYKGPPEDVSL